MGKVILILWVINGWGVASPDSQPHSAEYSSVESCLQALSAIKKSVKNLDGVCTLK